MKFEVRFLLTKKSTFAEARFVSSPMNKTKSLDMASNTGRTDDVQAC